MLQFWTARDVPPTTPPKTQSLIFVEVLANQNRSQGIGVSTRMPLTAQTLRLPNIRIVRARASKTDDGRTVGPFELVSGVHRGVAGACPGVATIAGLRFAPL